MTRRLGVLMRRRSQRDAGGDRIEASRLPGVAATETPGSEPAAPEHAEALDRLERVTGAARIEAAARAEERAHRPLIEAYQERGEVAHCSPTLFQSAARLACNAFAFAATAAVRTLTTRSSGGSSR